MRKLLLVTLVLAACGSSKKQEPEQTASCNMPSLHSCREYSKANLVMGTERLSELCTSISDTTFTETPCPTEGVIGRCDMPEGDDVFYTGYELGDPAEGCERRQGKFTKK